MTPDWNYNPGKAGQRLLNKIEADKLNRASPKLKRETIQYDLSSSKFKDEFQKGDVRGWDLAVLPDDVAQALRNRGLKLPGQIVADGIKPRKLAQKHPKVSVEQYQALQRILDQGGVYVEAPVKWRKAPSLLAEYQDNKGQWWFYAINMKEMRTLTIFDSGPEYRARKLNQENIGVIREWDPHRWRKK